MQKTLGKFDAKLEEGLLSMAEKSSTARCIKTLFSTFSVALIDKDEKDSIKNGSVGWTDISEIHKRLDSERSEKCTFSFLNIFFVSFGPSNPDSGI